MYIIIIIKHEMNEHTGKLKVDTYPNTAQAKTFFVVENINLQKEVCKAPTWKRKLNISSSSCIYIDTALPVVE